MLGGIIPHSEAPIGAVGNLLDDHRGAIDAGINMDLLNDSTPLIGVPNILDNSHISDTLLHNDPNFNILEMPTDNSNLQLLGDNQDQT